MCVCVCGGECKWAKGQEPLRACVCVMCYGREARVCFMGGVGFEGEVE